MKTTRSIFAISVTALTLLPIAAVMLTAMLAAITGCDVNESAPQTCQVLGVEIGGLLATLMATGWMALFLIPLVIVIALLWAVFEAGAYLYRRRRLRRLR